MLARAGRARGWKQRMASAGASTIGAHQLNFCKSAEEIRSSLRSLISRYEAEVQAIVDADDRSFAATFGRLADADGLAALFSAELTLPAQVSGEKAVRDASADAKAQLQQMWSKSYARADLYHALEAAAGLAAGSEEQRLVEVVLAKLRHVGAHLPEAQRKELEELDQQCGKLCLQAEQNINEDCSSVDLTPADLEGCAESFVESLPSTEAGLKRCALKAPTLVPILQRCKSSATRRRMMEASQRKCIEVNTPVLEELIAARHTAAVKLGFSCHAERMLASKMAGNLKTAKGFVEEMLQRLRPLRDRDLKRLGQRKQADVADGNSNGDRKRKSQVLEEHPVDLWDLSYYSDLLKREELLLDDEKVKEFFPLEGTIQRILDVYTELLGLSFHRNDQLPVWHKEVMAFEVKEQGEVVGHLFLDQFPRDGKFSHQMIFPLAPAFTSSSNQRCVPACVNISNLPRSEGSRPALLRFSEMKTLFHELGHVMHCLCTSTRFSILSWAWPMVPWPGGVEQDFLEVPSMALEKFTSDQQLLQRVAKHFETAKELDGASISKIQELESWMAGIQESRIFGVFLFDLLLHSQAPPYSFDGHEKLSIPELYRHVMEKCTTLPQLPNINFCTSWYHIYVGYDAGYYGYGWADVYAADIFATMQSSKLGALSAETGRQLRSEILGPCATKSGEEMLQNFLKREPSVEPWCRLKGI